ncbi:MAG TPA: biotin/lipoyl-containing protein, partial [Candidatus Saccharimonadales bacterium]|nr:biotin/lipoyl-containing protein [Candidatus Saccharimonadales bacterium]
MLTEVRLPQLNANDTTVRLVAWLVPDGAAVSEGQPLCAVETTKASAELDAERAGRLRHGAAEGDELEVGALIAWIGDGPAEIEGLVPAGSATEGPVVTEKARRLAARLGVDLSRVTPSGGFVRERDVRAFAGSLGPDPFEPSSLAGAVDPEFAEAIARDPSFAGLPSDQKIAAYREHGAAIGERVVIGEGSVIDARYLELKDEASVGKECRIKAESFSLGRMSIIGDRADIMARHIRIGDVLYSGAGVLIGGGGAWGAESRLVVGDSCLISRHCVLDTGRGIRIGNEVGLSPHVKMFTHNHWQNVLEGYHANFGPIVVEDRAFITGDSIVVPGVRIGEGATVLANSTVSADVAPYTVVSGNPARVVGRIDRRVSPERKERIILRLLEEMKSELAGRIPEGSVSYARAVDLADPGLSGIVLTLAPSGGA